MISTELLILLNPTFTLVGVCSIIDFTSFVEVLEDTVLVNEEAVCFSSDISLLVVVPLA